MSGSITQKAFVWPGPGKACEVQHVRMPKPAVDEILVKVHVAALNPIDGKILLSERFARFCPFTLGWDGAGTVEEIGSSVIGFSKGDRVIFQGWVDQRKGAVHGTLQQYVSIRSDVIAKIPNNVTFEQAATVFSCLATAACPLYSQKPGTVTIKLTPPWEAAGLNKYTGQSIFIAGGATQVGIFTIQCAKLSGFSPIITTASSHNAELVKSYGATHVIDRTLPTEEIVEEVKSVAGGFVNLSYDTVTVEETLALSVGVLRDGGPLLYVRSGVEEDLRNRVSASGRTFELLCVRAMMSTEENRGALAGLWAKLPHLLENGMIKPTKYEVLPGGLNGAFAGLDRMQKDQVSGVKLILHPHETL